MDLDLISDLTAALEAATSLYDIPDESPCPEEEVCDHPVCRMSGCVADKIGRARAVMAAAGWDHIPGDADSRARNWPL